MEVIDLGLDDLDTVKLDLNTEPTTESSSSSSLGAGIELLMNEKKKSSNSATTIDLGEIDKLETELNDLTAPSGGSDSNTKSLDGGLFGSFFGGSNEIKKEGSEPASIHINDTPSDSKIGQATSDSMGNTKTWDGFSKVNDFQSSATPKTTLNEREKRRKKRLMIKKIDEWYEKGLIKHNPHFNMESNFEEVEDEYETAREDKRKKDSIKLQGWWFMTAVNSLEYANSAFNPFDINLDGWGEQVSEDIDSYEEIFSELHDKYKGGKLSPEISLVLRLGFSAAVVNFTNKALSSATPAFNDVIKQSPELMKMFTNATVDSMSQASPGFNFANNMMKDATGPSMNMGPPPAPVETKSMPFSGQRPGNNTGTYEQPQVRPDVSLGRGASVPSQEQPPKRNEMRGPQTEIDSILSVLKTRTVEMHKPEPAMEDSIISVSSLKDMQDTPLPKRTRRRGSAKNTISLDI